jgi:transposase-like protein
VIAKRVYEQSGRKISPTSLQKMVADLGERCKTPLEMSQEFRPQWNGVLLLDEKMCSVRGKHQWFYVALDSSGDVVHCRPVLELTVTEALAFVTEIVTAFAVPWKGIVTDLDTVLSRAVALMFAETPHQYCLKHAFAVAEQLMGYTPWARRRTANRDLLREQFERLPGRKGLWRQRAHDTFVAHYAHARAFTEQFNRRDALRTAVHDILFAQSEEEAQVLFHTLRHARRYDREGQRKVVAFLNRHWTRFMAHHHCPGLPRTSNIIESFNKQLERRFKTIEAFQHRATARSYVNLLVAYLRQKPYTDCRNSRKHLNGKSRLQAAHVTGLSHDWLRHALKSPVFSNR